MKNLIVVLVLLAVSVCVCQASSYPRDPVSQELIQGPRFSGLASAVLTVNSVTYDMRLYPVFSVYAPADCKIRLMASTSKTGSVSEPVLGGQWTTLIIHAATPYANFSGCTSGVLRRQPK